MRDEKIEEAKEIMIELLKDGPMDQEYVKQKLRDKGITRGEQRMARAHLDTSTTQKDGKWYWAL